MTSIEILNKLLIGNVITGYSISDWFCIYLHDYYLVCQNFTSPDELEVNESLRKSYAKTELTIDKDNVAKCTILAANIRKEIIAVQVNELSEINICFKNGSDLLIKTDTTIVDWQWCINKNGNDPYNYKNEIACFWKGKIE
ncbi:hypothetical protein JCM19297_1414 [Nonlabens ulvanivorans]|nr:hypothetical protein [Nonlabens ulvanivorans]GAK89586.1 hypothetical protein JCM19297_1414 [Nonlabens ulvanivorans]